MPPKQCPEPCAHARGARGVGAEAQQANPTFGLRICRIITENVPWGAFAAQSPGWLCPAALHLAHTEGDARTQGWGCTATATALHTWLIPSSFSCPLALQDILRANFSGILQGKSLLTQSTPPRNPGTAWNQEGEVPCLEVLLGGLWGHLTLAEFPTWPCLCGSSRICQKLARN